MFIALQNASDWANDPGHRQNPLFHAPIHEAAEIAFHDGFALSFDDAAVSAFCRIIFCEPEPFEPSISTISMKLNTWASFARLDGLHNVYNSEDLNNLLTIRSGSGWEQIDALLILTCGISLSRFFDTVEALYLSEDPGLGSSTCFRLKIGTGMNDDLNWFAVASTFDGIVELFRRALESRLLDAYLAKTDLSQTVVSATVLHNEKSVLKVPMKMEGCVVPSWSGVEIPDLNLRIIKSLAGLAPEDTILRLKGKILESELGM
jgi:hypothetical protein